MDHQRIEINESPIRHEIGIIWKVITVVVSVLAAIAWPLYLVSSYSTTLETRNTASMLYREQVQKDIDALNHRIDSLDRFREFHLRNHAPATGPAWQGRQQ